MRRVREESEKSQRWSELEKGKKSENRQCNGGIDGGDLGVRLTLFETDGEMLGEKK